MAQHKTIGSTNLAHLWDKIVALLPNVMKGSTSTVAGEAGLVPAPPAESQEKFLRGDGTWVKPEGKWQECTSSQEGYVASGQGQSNAFWGTDAKGNPAWRDLGTDIDSAFEKVFTKTK